MDRWSAPLEAFLACLREAEQRCHMAEADEQEESGVTQDILHNLELVEHTGEELLALGTELAESRRRRRRAKDTLQAAGPLVLYAEGHRRELKDLEKLLGEVRRAERATEGRIYTPRSGRCGPS